MKENPNLPVEPSRELSAQLLQEAQATLLRMRESLRQAAAQSPLNLADLQDWLGSTLQKEMVRETPALKEVVAAGKTAMKPFAKEQAADLDVSLQALDEVETALAEFTANQKRPNHA